MNEIGAVTVALIIILISLFGYLKWIIFGYWKFRGVPHDKPILFSGQKMLHPSQFFKNLYDKYKPTGAKICGTYFFIKPWAILLDRELVKNVLVKDFDKFNDRGLYYNDVDDPQSAHLFALNGEKWRNLRRKLSPIFTSGQMKFMFSSVVEVGERFIDSLREKVEVNNELEIKDILARFTTDIIGRCVFGIESDSLNNENDEFRRFGRKLFEQPRYSARIRRLMDGFSNICRKFHLKKIPDDIAAFFMNLSRKEVEFRENNNNTKNDLMDLLIKLKNEPNRAKAITFDELAATAFVFFQAGFESSSSTLAFCLYELALNTEIQDRARKIIREALEKYGGLTYDMMMDLPYINQIIFETLRKYTPASSMPRIAQTDYHVPNSSIVIEKGTTVHIPVHALHHDPEYFREPDRFDPGRFEIEERKKHESMTWLAFGDGPRNCIGQRFGMMQIRVGLIKILNNFEFSLGSIHGKTSSIPINQKVYLLTPEYVFLKLTPLNE